MNAARLIRSRGILPSSGFLRNNHTMSGGSIFHPSLQNNSIIHCNNYNNNDNSTGSNSSNTSRSHITMSRRFIYTAMTPQEEEAEKNRVAGLSATQKAQELKQLDRELALLNMKRGINSGELYTLRGKFKALARDYGVPFMAWYWTVWVSTATLVYGCIEVGGFDAIELIARVDSYTGWSIASHVDPTVGTIGLTLAVNELLEPLRLPIVVVTTKPVVDALFPSSLK